MEFKIDGSRDNDEWYKRTQEERIWRAVASDSTKMRACVLRPEVRAVMEESIHNHVYGYRYLEPEHLDAPWTPSLLLNIWWVRKMVAHYQSWNKLGDHPWPWWDGADVSDPTASTGERVFQVALHTFRQAGLDDWVAWVEVQREKYRRRVTWLAADRAGWVPFRIDLNSPSLILDVTGPADWQVVVDAVLAEELRLNPKTFLRQMRASISQDETRKHEPGMPFGYETSTKMSSFGYRWKHRTDSLFVEWVAATMPDLDLFGPDFWPKESVCSDKVQDPGAPS